MKSIIIADAHFREINYARDLIDDAISTGGQLIVPGDFSDEYDNITTLKELKEKYDESICIVPGNHDENVVNTKGEILSPMYSERGIKYSSHLARIKRSKSYDFLETIVNENKGLFESREHPQTKIDGVIIYHAYPDFNFQNYYATMWYRMRNAKFKYKNSRMKHILKKMRRNSIKGLVRGHDHDPMIVILRDEELIISTLNDHTRIKGIFTQKTKQSVLNNPIRIEENDVFMFNPGLYQEGFFGEITNDEKSIELCIRKIIWDDELRKL